MGTELEEVNKIEEEWFCANCNRWLDEPKYSKKLDAPVCPRCGDPNICTKAYASFVRGFAEEQSQV